VRAAADVLRVMAGPDPQDPNTLNQPALELQDLEAGVAGLRIGWPARWVAQADEPLQAMCRAALERLRGEGAIIREVDIEHLERVRPVQYITLGVEMATAQYENRRRHQREYGGDTRLLLEMASHLPAVDYLRAQRLRSLIRDSFARTLGEVDLIATPSTATTAPPLRPQAEVSGESDDTVLEGLTAFSFAANLTGLPALSVPVGYLEGLPVGLQLMGGWWKEGVVLRAGLALEKHLDRRAPAVCYRLLG
jgi:aspartyl-tRNA(Asn)/glutamyl-tRNA(Gln) amidotransferase subunit A